METSKSSLLSTDVLTSSELGLSAASSIKHNSEYIELSSVICNSYFTQHIIISSIVGSNKSWQVLRDLYIIYVQYTITLKILSFNLIDKLTFTVANKLGM